MLPWLWVLLGLVGLQVALLVAMGRSRRARAEAEENDTETDWRAVEDDLARMVGPAVRELVDECGGRSPDAEQLRTLAEALADQARESHGLTPTGADALARSLGDELARIAVPVPVG